MSSTTSTTTSSSTTSTSTRPASWTISQQLLDLYADILYQHKIIDMEEADRLKGMARGDEEMQDLGTTIIQEKLKLL